MTMYYILIDTEKERVGIREGNSLDDVNEKFLTEVFFMTNDRLHELGDTDWKEMGEKCNNLYRCLTKLVNQGGIFDESKT